MTAQLARIKAAIASTRAAIGSVGTAIWDLLVVAVAVGAIGILAVPIVHHAWNYWSAFASAWAPTPPAKTVAKK
jgi:hypothetical protein